MNVEPKAMSIGGLREVDSIILAPFAGMVAPSEMAAGSVKTLVTVWSPATHIFESASKLSAYTNKAKFETV